MSQYQKNETQYKKYNTIHHQSLIKVCTEPENRFTPQGKQVASFSTVFTECYNTQDGSQMFHDEWVKITAWEKAAEATMNFHKGEWMLIETVIPSIGRWEGTDGKEHSNFEIRMKGFPRKVQLVATGASQVLAQEDLATEEVPPEDGIPF